MHVFSIAPLLVADFDFDNVRHYLFDARFHVVGCVPGRDSEALRPRTDLLPFLPGQLQADDAIDSDTRPVPPLDRPHDLKAPSMSPM